MFVIVYGTYEAVNLEPRMVEKLPGFISLEGDTGKLWEAGKAVAQSENLTSAEYNECFYDWYDAVTGCGVNITAEREFHELLDIAITEFGMW